jgi:hypothetical protein
VSAAPPPSSSPDETNPSGVYALVLVVEVLVITALYWVGRHFS